MLKRSDPSSSSTNEDKTQPIPIQFGELMNIVEGLKTIALTLKNSSITMNYASLASQLINERNLRAKYICQDILSEPGWAMLLDLFRCAEDRRQVAVTSTCLASGSPMTTALRTLTLMKSEGLINKHGDPTDSRRVLVELTPTGREMVIDYLNEVAKLRNITLVSSDIIARA